jgi:hypothetical protein
MMELGNESGSALIAFAGVVKPERMVFLREIIK